MARKNRNFKKINNNNKDDYDEEFEFDGPSRTTVKLDLRDRQQQVAEWPDLPMAQLKSMPLEDDLIEQLLHARELKADSGRRRLLRFVAKRVDEEDFAAVEAHLADAQRTSLAAVQTEKACEKWRERVLAGDDAVTEFFEKYQNAEHQMLRQTVRQARAEIKRSAEGKTVVPVAQRKLFKMLRDTVMAAQSEIE